MERTIKQSHFHGFDGVTGELWVGEVGQDKFEEVSIIGRGDNMGWNIVEADHCFSPASGCKTEGLKPPVMEVPRTVGNCIIGGYVYRGNTASPYSGLYFFSDLNGHQIYAMRHAAGKMTEYKLMAESRLPISSMGTDREGNLYVVNIDHGSIDRLESPHLGSSLLDRAPQRRRLGRAF